MSGAARQLNCACEGAAVVQGATGREYFRAAMQEGPLACSPGPGLPCGEPALRAPLDASNGVASPVNSQLLEQVVDVVLHRCNLDPKLPSDLLVGKALIQQPQDGEFPDRQR